MIYLDTSVALAHLLGEGRGPPEGIWRKELISSRLLEYELWTRVHSRGLTRSHGGLVQRLLQGIAIVELSPLVLARALEPFPVPVRTLDALHLSTIEYLRSHERAVELASYDERLVAGARGLGISTYRL